MIGHDQSSEAMARESEIALRQAGALQEAKREAQAANNALEELRREHLSAVAKHQEDLIAAATNDAVRRVEETSKEKMGEVTGGMGLPPGFKMPF